MEVLGPNHRPLSCKTSLSTMCKERQLCPKANSIIPSARLQRINLQWDKGLGYSGKPHANVVEKKETKCFTSAEQFTFLSVKKEN